MNNHDDGIYLIYKMLYLLFVTLLQMVAAVQEAMPSHHPLLLDQSLEAMQTPAVRITHQLHQTGNHTAQVPVLLLCTRTHIDKIRFTTYYV